jgi:hypothetical protein
MAIQINGTTVIHNDRVFQVAAGTTAARPATPLQGMLRYNTTLSEFEGYNGTVWGPVTATNLTVTAGTTAGPTINSSTGANVTLPTASATASGVVTTGAQTWAGVKTLTSPVINTSITGTAVTQSTTDTTTGRLLRLGDYGLGGVAIAIGSETDLNNVWRAGWYRWIGSNIPVNAPSTFGVMTVMARDANNDIHQMVLGNGSLLTRAYTNSIWRPWRFYYNDANILGTVSQTSGVPTGAIIERGSNANGEFVRFADGTQVCTVSGVTFTFNSADILAYTWTYPAAFSAQNASGSATFSVTGADYVGVVRASLGIVGQTTSVTSGAWNVYRTSGAASFVSGNEVRNVRLMAVGRWF